MSKRLSVGFIYFGVVLMTLLLRISSALDIYSALGVDSDAFFTGIVQIVIFGVMSISLYLLCVTKRRGESFLQFRQDFGIRRTSFRNWLRVVGVTVCMIIVANAISVVWQSVLSLMGYVRVPSSTDYYDIGVLFRELVLVALLPGVFEEVAHRGLLYAGYKETGWKFVLVSAVLFSLMHQNIVQTGYTMFDGAVIALTMYYTGSIFPCIFIHFVNNAVSVCSGYVAQNGGIFSFMLTLEQWLSGTAAGFAVSILAVFIAAGLLILFFKRMRNDAVRSGFMSPVPFESLSEYESRTGAVYSYSNGGDKTPEVSVLNGGDETPDVSVCEKDTLSYQNADATDSEAKSKTYSDILSAGSQNSPVKKQPLKLSHDPFFIATVALGIAATLFSLIWGMTR